MANDKRPMLAVRAVITNESGKVLILKRDATSYGDDEWCLPGGKIDFGQTATDAVAREVIEETSLVCKEIKFLFYQDSLPLTPGTMHCINFYLECLADGKLVLNEESVEAQWIGPEDLPRFSIAFRNDEGLVRYWAERKSS